MKARDPQPTLMRRILRTIIGPWGLHPFVMGGMLLIFFNISGTEEKWYESAAEGKGFLLMAQTLPTSLLSSGIVTSLLMLSLWLLRKRGRTEPSLLWYWMTLILAALPVVVYRMHLEGFTLSDMWSDLDLTVRTWIRLSAGMVILSNIVGFTLSRLQQQVEETESAYATIERQRQIILTTEEQSRRSIADFLHDHVQAGLVVIAMQLKELQRRLTNNDAATVGSLIESLDTLRAEDVRAASRRLSPELSVTGVASSLRDLGAIYAPAMRVEVNCAMDVDTRLRKGARNQEIALGIYRIVEQCMLNAATHGQASECSVDIAESREGRIIVTIADNGSGLTAPDPTAGRGTAVISGWSSVLGSSWNRRNHVKGGVVVEVDVPLPTATLD